MSPLFGGKKDAGKTVLLLDVENGSVASALAYITPADAPRLFGETRITIPLLKTHAPGLIAKEVEAAARKALQHISEVAARVRVHGAPTPLGTIAHTAVFLSPPWAAFDMTGSAMPHPITQSLYNALGESSGLHMHTSFHPFSAAVAHIVPSIFAHEERYLLCIVSGEVMEIVGLERAPRIQVTGHATLPLGRNSILRTLMSHGGLGEAEALSLLTLSASGARHTALNEPLASFAAHMAEEFKSVVEPLMAVAPASSVFVIAHEPTGEWFARALAEHPSIEKLFPEGGTVRAMRGAHVSPYLLSHAYKPDLVLLLEALFVDARLSVGQARFVK